MVAKYLNFMQNGNTSGVVLQSISFAFLLLSFYYRKYVAGNPAYGAIKDGFVQEE